MKLYNVSEVIFAMAQDRGLKTRTPISSTVKTELHQWLKQYSEETGIPISKLLDKSIELYQNSTNK